MSGLRFPPFVRPGAPPSDATVSRAPHDEVLPSIREFIDELPPIEDYLAEFADSESKPPSHDSFESAESVQLEDTPHEKLPVTAAEGWARADWQSYDWSSIASLNRQHRGRVTADESWGESDWPGDEGPLMSGYDTSVTPHAAEIADALDGLARRIRSGELVLDNLQGIPPEAAMAAALAVLFRMRG